MGSDERERDLARSLSRPETVAADWFSAELARHRAETGAFCIDRLLVTQQRYAEFVRRTGHRPPGISRSEYLRQGFLVPAARAYPFALLAWHRVVSDTLAREARLPRDARTRGLSLCPAIWASSEEIFDRCARYAAPCPCYPRWGSNWTRMAGAAAAIVGPAE
jgi:formylglycine-generating enzyme required for sulfatase activity